VPVMHKGAIGLCRELGGGSYWQKVVLDGSRSDDR